MSLPPPVVSLLRVLYGKDWLRDRKACAYYRAFTQITSCGMLHVYQCCNVVCLCSSGQPELQLQLQLRWSLYQPPLPASTPSHLQALFCVSRQVLRLPLWSQRLRGLQGNISGLWSTSQSALQWKCKQFVNVCHAGKKEGCFILVWKQPQSSQDNKHVNAQPCGCLLLCSLALVSYWLLCSEKIYDIWLVSALLPV